MSKPLFVFAPHAVERYIERFAPSMSVPEAHRLLSNSVRTATRRRSRTSHGDEVWHCTVNDVRVDCVIKRDSYMGNKSGICVTVLPEGNGDAYVPERRVSVLTRGNPADEALRIATRYAVASAGRGCERARRVVSELEHLVPWIVGAPANGDARAQSDSEHALAHDSDAEGVWIARLDNTGTDGGHR